MSLKPTIHFHVAGEAVPLKVAREFKPIVDLGRLKASSYTVIAYPGMRGESQSIVDSKSIGITSRRTNRCRSPQLYG
jgi:hypothetical protein